MNGPSLFTPPITIGGTTYGSNATGTSRYDMVEDDVTTTSATAATLKQGWRLPSVTDWRYILDGLGRIGGGFTLTDGTNAVTPTSPLGVSYPMVYRVGDDNSALQQALGMNYKYWSSSEYDSTNSWYYDFGYGKFSVSVGSTTYLAVRPVFAY